MAKACARRDLGGRSGMGQSGHLDAGQLKAGQSSPPGVLSGEAMDTARVLGSNESVTVADGSSPNDVRRETQKSGRRSQPGLREA